VWESGIKSPGFLAFLQIAAMDRTRKEGRVWALGTLLEQSHPSRKEFLMFSNNSCT